MYRSVLLAVVALAGAGAAMAAPSATYRFGTLERQGAAEVRLTANLGGGDAPQAKSTYRERVRNGIMEVRWKVELEDFAAGVDVPVSINGSLVGSIIPSALGGGEIQFRTVIDDPGDGVPLPEGFPRLNVGDTVTVGDLSATYH